MLNIMKNIILCVAVSFQHKKKEENMWEILNLLKWLFFLQRTTLFLKKSFLSRLFAQLFDAFIHFCSLPL